MPWTERQQTLLREMGLRVWVPPLAQPSASVPQSAVSQTPAAVADTSLRPTPAPAPQPAEPAAPHHPPHHPAPTPTEPIATSLLSTSSVAGLDWPALREAVAGCRACGLCESRTQTVFGVGHPQAHWMVIGEAPGEQEDLSGEPFVGPAGQLLDRMLAALQLTRAQDGPQPPSQRVYIANTLKCRPPRNRNPEADEMARCEPFLLRQIELLQPKMILAMGSFAVRALLRSSDPVGKLRGRVHRYHGVPLVVTYHPAYLLRNLPHKARAWEDLCLAADAAEATGAAGARLEQG